MALMVVMSVASASDLPPEGRSQFDRLIGAAPVPFPFSRLRARIEDQLEKEAAFSPVKITLIPLGRSLQRAASAPDFFRFPRVVLAVDGEARPGHLALKDRLFIGYNEKAAVLEVISYNESAGRFEFQVVQDYRAGARPQIFYVRRAVCLACHQNAAPIFARPLWDETPANPAIAARLKATGRDFYGVKLNGTDVAYFIDAAASRASLILVWQSLWRDGCGADDACRREWFTAALRYGLSGVLPGEADLKSLVSGLETRWLQVWPKGLAIPNANIPNRDPLMFIPETASLQPHDGLSPELARLAHIPARFEPLNVRPPLEVWQRPDKARMIAGLAGLIDHADLKMLDEGLRQTNSPAQKIKLDCRFTRKAAGSRIAFTCAGQDAKLVGDWSVGTGKVTGSVDEIVLPGAQTPTALDLAGAAGRFTLHRGDLRARLADGRLLAQLEFTGAETEQGAATLTLRDDFSAARAQLEKLPFPSAPFQAQAAMTRLFAVFTVQRTVLPDAPLPPPQVQAAATTSHGVGIQADFHRFCGQCHDTGERFPSNFLHGDDAAVSARINHCAERIYYRLSMWRLTETQRGKTPMPPNAALAQHGFDADTWSRAPELAALRTYAEKQLANPQGVLNQSFESLRACLPAH